MSHSSAVSLELEEYSISRVHTGRNVFDLDDRLADRKETQETKDVQIYNSLGDLAMVLRIRKE